jgi:hypothetical protein
VTSSRRSGLLALGFGLALVLGARLVPGLGGPPLYDGVVPVGPYLWLQPADGQQGGAQGATARVAVKSGQNDLVALATPESMPQAQVLAIPGAFVLPAESASLDATIEPVPPAGQPMDGQLASNVYRFSVKDAYGGEVPFRASAQVSIVLRSADPTLLSGVIERWNGTVWVPIKTAPPQTNGGYLAVVTELGDFAVVKPGTLGPGGSGAASPGAASSGSASSASASSGNGFASGSPVASALAPGPSAADGGNSSGGTSLVLPLAAAAVVAIVVFVVLVLVGRRSQPGDPRPPSRPTGRSSGRPPNGRSGTGGRRDTGRDHAHPKDSRDR